MKKPHSADVLPETDPPEGGRALGRMRQFTESRGLTVQSIVSKVLPETVPDPAATLRKTLAEKKSVKPRTSRTKR